MLNLLIGLGVVALVIAPLGIHAGWMAISVGGSPFRSEFWTDDPSPREPDEIDALVARFRLFLATVAAEMAASAAQRRWS